MCLECSPGNNGRILVLDPAFRHCGFPGINSLECVVFTLLRFRILAHNREGGPKNSSHAAGFQPSIVCRNNHCIDEKTDRCRDERKYMWIATIGGAILAQTSKYCNIKTEINGGSDRTGLTEKTSIRRERRIDLGTPDAKNLLVNVESLVEGFHRDGWIDNAAH